MADYRSFCSECGESTGFGGAHSRSCSKNSDHKEWLREQKLKKDGFEARIFSTGSPTWEKITLFKCLRGCGTYVHDFEAHMRNVCTTYPED